MPSAPHDSEWYRPDKTEVAPEDLVLLMELAGVGVRHNGERTFLQWRGVDYVVPLDEDGTWQRNAYEMWQWLKLRE